MHILPDTFSPLSVTYNSPMQLNAIQLIATLYYLGNSNKNKSRCVFGTDAFFSFSYSQLIKYIGIEPIETGAALFVKIQITTY